MSDLGSLILSRENLMEELRGDRKAMRYWLGSHSDERETALVNISERMALEEAELAIVKRKIAERL